MTEIQLEFNDHKVIARSGETLLQLAKRLNIEIPHLCYLKGYPQAGNCRACMVEIIGERTLAAACCRQAADGMKVRSDSERAIASQKMVLELLKTDNCDPAVDSELDIWSKKIGVKRSRFPASNCQTVDLSHAAIVVDLNACIHCTRCIRACRDIQVNDVIGFAYRGHDSKIIFDLDDKMGLSSCVSCGECVQACPTAALSSANELSVQSGETLVDSVCPYCGVGCLLSWRVKDNRIIGVKGRDGPSNHGRLCVKGRYGFDYVHHPDRLLTPLKRKEGKAKTQKPLGPDDMLDYFEPIDWDEALRLAAQGFTDIRDSNSPSALAGFGSAKGSNEEAYLFQKLIRTGFGTHNVDHCTRLCHASSVAALLEGIGSGAVSNPVADVSETDVIIIIGAKPTVNHPVAATFMKNAVASGKQLILMDPYRSDLARHATHFLQFHPSTDVVLLNAIMFSIIKQGLQDDDYIQNHTEDFDALKNNLKDYAPDRVAGLCGIDAQTIDQVARCYASANNAMIFWGMGISQHTHGTDNARCLIALALLTGHIGKPGNGLHPLRGQNNVQGASDMGLIPMMLPNYRRTSDESALQDFERLWSHPLSTTPGLTVVEIMQAIHHETIEGLYIMGENPAMSDPNLNHTRAALAKLKHLVVQDIFFTETASYADVILPASAFAEKTGTFTNTDRRVQMARQAIDLPGAARQDLWIIQQMAERLGLSWSYPDVESVFEEIRQAVPSIAGMTWQRLENEHSLTYPLTSEDDSGTAVLFTDGFPTQSGRARFVPASYSEADELPDETFPMIFTTGRQLEHWHTGSMTRRSSVLNTLQPEPVINIHPQDMTRHGLEQGQSVIVQSRRGEIKARCYGDSGLQVGSVFMAFCYYEAAANLLTNEALDPIAKIPEFKYCAVRLVTDSITQT